MFSYLFMPKGKIKNYNRNIIILFASVNKAVVVDMTRAVIAFRFFFFRVATDSARL